MSGFHDTLARIEGGTRAIAVTPSHSYNISPSADNDMANDDASQWFDGSPSQATSQPHMQRHEFKLLS